MAHSPEHQEFLPLNPLIGEALPVPMPAPVYNPERVWQRLALPLLQEENHISADLEIFHVQKRSSLLRIMTGLEAETKIYLGGWYYQGEEPTCTPWAIANAGRVLGLTVSVDFMMDLMSLACRNRGLDFGEASIVLASHYQCSSFELVRASKKGLTSLVRVNYKSANDSQNPDRAAEKRVKLLRNCIFFRSALNQNLVPLVEVDAGLLWNKPILCKRQHAVAISGYLVNAARQMDLQVIDPAKGVYITSLEHFSHSLSSRYEDLPRFVSPPYVCSRVA